MRWSRLVVVLAAALCAAPLLSAQPPRLVLFVSVDQLRADHPPRYAEQELPENGERGPGGFRFLAGGAVYTAARVAHVPAETGPGHATLLTGSAPCLDGIVANDWYDRTAGKVRYCVDDGSVSLVGGTGRPVSPRALRVTTVGDELKLATAGNARVVSLAFKDRAAVLMAGHAADDVLWLDRAGNWVTSTFYAAALPEWASRLNAERFIDTYFERTGSPDRVWTPLLDASAYALTRPAAGGGGVVFRHVLDESYPGCESAVCAFVRSGLGNDYLFEAARRAVVAEGLGRDDVPDLLALSLSSNDSVGHRYGPYSPEIMDVTLRTDRALAAFLAFLDSRVPGGLDRVLVVLTADHGLAPAPEELQDDARVAALRVRPGAVAAAAETALEARFGTGPWVLAPAADNGDTGPYLYLDRTRLAAEEIPAAGAEEVAAQAAAGVPGVLAAFTRSQLLAGAVPPWPWVRSVTNGFHPVLSGDVVVVPAPGSSWSGSDSGSGHGAPWPPDTRVPLLLRGPGIHAGTFSRPVTTMDVAPTITQILGIATPSGCLGEPLREALDSGVS